MYRNTKLICVVHWNVWTRQHNLSSFYFWLVM